MEPKRALAIALLLELMALVLLSGSRRLLDRAFYAPWDAAQSTFALQVSIVVAVAIIVLASLALAFLVRVFRRGTSGDKAVAAALFLVGLMHIAAGLFVLWDGVP